MKKLWDTKAFTSGDTDSRKGKALVLFSSHLLTILLAVFLLIVASILAIVIYTSNGGGNQEKSEQAFYNPSKSQVAEPVPSTSSMVPDMSTVEEPEAQEEAEAQRPQPNGGTLEVLPGEGAGSIAARAGISVEHLYALNPDKMVGPGGTWWANPGDVVYID